MEMLQPLEVIGCCHPMQSISKIASDASSTAIKPQIALIYQTSLVTVGPSGSERLA
jgi:hypothetical protein